MRARELTASDVHILAVSLDVHAGRVAELDALLSTDERERARRFVFDRDRRRFVVCRGTLREILGGYLDAPPERLRFAYGAHGKPRLEGASQPPPLSFNLSHSHELAVYAVCLHADLGVDVEHLRPMPDAMALAARFLPGEEALLTSLAPEDRAGAFLQCWTRKEAAWKADGSGMFAGWESPAGWSIHDLGLSPGYVGSVALPVALPGVTLPGAGLESPARWRMTVF